METPNFDAMTQEELRDFWGKWHVTTRKRAVVVTGDRKDARQIMETLACYAINKSCAVGLRLEGEIERAMTYEHACELTYGRLPEDVRW
jgi:hypothetical protein